MKNFKWALFGVLSFALLSQQARAVPYTFSQGSWPGGGEITGSFDIDLNHSTPTPGFLYAEALTSFSAHWTGNVYSQPYDWDLSQVSFAYFLFAIGSERTIDMVLNGDVQYDSTLPLVWDFRPSALPIGPDWTSAQYYGTGPLNFERRSAVPDTNYTMPLLAFAMLLLYGFSRWRKLTAPR